MSRLTRADRGELSCSLTVITDPPSSHARGYQWALDPLGNWAGGAYVGSGAPGLSMSGIPDGSGGYQTVGITHSTDAFNALTGITTKVGTGSPSTDDIGASADGSITSDAGYIYQYDLLGRLVQVNRRDGESVGPWVKHYTYDSLGRLIRTQTPYPSNISEILSYTEHYYYDGDRRIQEVATGVQLNEDGKPVYVKDELSLQTIISRDYVWDPDGGDSLIAQFDAANDVWFVISSLSGDAAALMSESGSVVAQYAFDSYGNVLDTDTLAPHSPLWIGHKGLFFDRLDQPLNPQRLAAGAEGHYHNRARTYAPRLGRFMQADPNASGLPTAPKLAWMGTSMIRKPQFADAKQQFGDGLNLLQYAKSAPVRGSDPTGLFILEPMITGASRLGRGYELYDRGQSVFDLAKSLAMGINMQQALLGFAAEMVLDKYGGGAFEKVLGGFTKFGRALQRSIKIPGHEWHHIFPKFLGGRSDGLLALVPQQLHQQFHGDLLRRMAQSGIRVPSPEFSNWDDVLLNPAVRDRALDMLKQATRDFDAAHNTHLFDALIEQFTRQGM